MKKKALILYNDIGDFPTIDEADVLAQVESVLESLSDLGYETVSQGVGLNLEKTAAFLHDSRPYFVFNLVESLNKKDHLISVVPLLLDTLGIPYTGNRSQSLQLTSGKTISKKLFRLCGIPTPGWMGLGEHLREPLPLDPPFIVKSMWEHASASIDEYSVAHSLDSLKEIVRRKIEQGDSHHYFIEQFIDGRELNVSVLGGAKGPQVLPCAEIHFTEFSSDQPKIVGYRAKWVEDSHEYMNTPRSFQFSPEDDPIIAKIRAISLECWNSFDLRGYARVDYRIGPDGAPYVLEINANPCISPDSGFMAAAHQAGMERNEVIRRIIEDTMKEYF